MASTTSNSTNVAEILASIAASTEAVVEQRPRAREQVLALAHQLVSSLETPSETLQRMGWAEPARFAATQLAVDLKIFEKLEEAHNRPVSLSELAASTGADAALIARTMKHLSATNMISETGVDEYTSTPISTALTIPKYRDGIGYLFNVAGPSFHSIPAYLKKTGYENPGNIADGPFQLAHKTQKPFFIWLAENPGYAEQFNNYMSGYRQGKSSWCDEGFYPVTERIGQDINSEAPLLVDVGGGIGHDLLELRTKHPELTGRLVLQDQADVIKQTEDSKKGIEVAVHDFFTPQPIKGAKAYYLHSVLHDWDDASSLKILSNIVPAMTPGYSKVLINEYVVPDFGAAWPMTSMDWLMMALGAVKERTEKQWRELLQQAGLKLTGIWTYEQGTESLIEAEVAA
ncbi:S-adenosyl-L-methionine-dependent methyltransferase [Usnea florida]